MPAPTVLRRLQNLNRNEVVALFRPAHREADFYTSLLCKRGRSRLGIVGEACRPVLADLGENGSDVVVTVGHLLEHDHAELVGLAGGRVGDGDALLIEFRREVERDDGELLVDDVLGVELGAVAHELAEKSGLLRGLSEVECHSNILSSSGCQPLNFFG